MSAIETILDQLGPMLESRWSEIQAAAGEEGKVNVGVSIKLAFGAQTVGVIRVSYGTKHKVETTFSADDPRQVKLEV